MEIEHGIVIKECVPDNVPIDASEVRVYEPIVMVLVCKSSGFIDLIMIIKGDSTNWRIQKTCEFEEGEGTKLSKFYVFTFYSRRREK